MDLNYFLSREQVSLMRAGVAVCVESRAAHLGLAREYRRQIWTAFPQSQSATAVAQ